MNTLSSGEPQLEAVEHQTSDQTQGDDATLVELGKVSDTQGAIFGSKPDIGNGAQFF